MINTPILSTRLRLTLITGKVVKRYELWANCIWVQYIDDKTTMLSYKVLSQPIPQYSLASLFENVLPTLHDNFCVTQAVWEQALRKYNKEVQRQVYPWFDEAVVNYLMEYANECLRTIDIYFTVYDNETWVSMSPYNPNGSNFWYVVRDEYNDMDVCHINVPKLTPPYHIVPILNKVYDTAVNASSNPGEAVIDTIRTLYWDGTIKEVDYLQNNHLTIYLDTCEAVS